MEKHFAAMKIPSVDAAYKLTRAVSFSELPSARRICVEQSYQTPHTPGLVRQYSCEQIFDNGSNTKQVKISEVVRTGTNEHANAWEATVPCFDTFKVPAVDWKTWPKNSIVQPAKFTKDEVEYMEVDEIEPPGHSASPETSAPPPLSNAPETIDSDPTEAFNVKTKQDSGDTAPRINYQDIKKKIRPMVPTNAKESRSRLCSFMILFFILLPITALLLGIFISNEITLQSTCDHHGNFHNASIELEEKIHGQAEAVHELVEYLRRNDSCLKVAALVGGTGVGKSYTAEILRRNFPNRNKIFLYYPPLQSNAKTNGLSSLFCNLIILENLGEPDLPDFVSYAKAVQEKENDCVTVIGIFNMEHVEMDLTRKVDLTENVDKIRKSLQDGGVSAVVIGYKALTEDTLEKCIVEAAAESDLSLTKEQIDLVKESLVQFNSGCKGAYSRVQLVGRE